MLSLEIEVYVSDDVLNMGARIAPQIEEMSDAAANYIADAYRHYVQAVGAVDTGELLESIHVEGGDITLYSGGGSSYYSSNRAIAERYAGAKGSGIVERKFSKADLARFRVSDIRPDEYYIPDDFGNHKRYVVASADHARVVEFGWTLRGRGQSSYPGRFPAGRAVEQFLTQFRSGNMFRVGLS